MSKSPEQNPAALAAFGFFVSDRAARLDNE
jgi:hypothetical protein